MRTERTEIGAVDRIGRSKRFRLVIQVAHKTITRSNHKTPLLRIGETGIQLTETVVVDQERRFGIFEKSRLLR